MVEDANKASGALGQAARESDTWTNQTGNLKQAWTDFQSVLGQNVLPLAVGIVKKMADAVQSVSDKMPGMINWFNQYKGVIAGVAAVIGVLTTAVGLHLSLIHIYKVEDEEQMCDFFGVHGDEIIALADEIMEGVINRVDNRRN